MKAKLFVLSMLMMLALSNVVLGKPLLQPTIIGPSEGNTDIDYTFSIILNDSVTDIKFIIEWGDGNSNESDYLEVGSFFTIHHKWTHPGEYTIHVTAFDGQTNATTIKSIKIYTPNESGANIPESSNFLLLLLTLLALILLLYLFLLGSGKKDE